MMKAACAFALVMLGLLSACTTGSDSVEKLPTGVHRVGVGSLSALAGGPADGRTVVYVHGTPGSADQWLSYLETPVAGARSIAVDRPGFGRSSPDTEPSFASQAAALEPVLEQAGDDLPVLVGHSLGGPIVARAAADFPHRVGAIVILAGSLDPQLEKPRWYNHLAGGLRGVLSRSIRNSNDEIMAAPAETLALARVLDRVVCPVVILHGKKDGLVPVGNVAFMERAFANAPAVEATILDTAGHLLVWRREADTRNAIERAMRLAWR